TGSSQVGAKGDLHVQQGVKPAAFHLLAQLGIALTPGLLVEKNELDTGQVADQFRLDLADHPGNSDAGNLFLEAQYHGYDMGDIADRGKAENADGLHRVIIRYRFGKRVARALPAIIGKLAAILSCSPAYVLMG